jgi:hypothetical protein
MGLGQGAGRRVYNEMMQRSNQDTVMLLRNDRWLHISFGLEHWEIFTSKRSKDCVNTAVRLLEQYRMLKCGWTERSSALLT